jgi:hypothetical protein
MTTRTREELEEMTAEERRIHFENERRAVFGYDYKTDKHGRPIEQGRGSPNNPTLQSMGALLATEGMDAYNKAIKDAVARGVWPPEQLSDEAAFQKAQALAAKLAPHLPRRAETL